MSNKFSAREYHSASKAREYDMNHLLTDTNSMIFSIYCSGVAVECILKAHILLETNEYDSKHDLKRHYEKSKLGLQLTSTQRERFIIAIKKVDAIWDNNLRYTSHIRMKRILAHKIARANYKDFNKYLKKITGEFFISVEYILKCKQ